MGKQDFNEMMKNKIIEDMQLMAEKVFLKRFRAKKKKFHKVLRDQLLDAKINYAKMDAIVENEIDKILRKLNQQGMSNKHCESHKV
jgi:hypothetical protein